MKLIIGLGNPGRKYKNNRHNVGHVVADKLKVKSGKLRGVVVTKTNTFMNDSGSFVKHLISWYPGILVSDIYIVHDDLDIPLGSYKIQQGRGPKEHKGLESIDNALGTSDYWHVRIGVDNRDSENRISGEEYVLQNFTDEEREDLDLAIKKTVEDLTQKLVG